MEWLLHCNFLLHHSEYQSRNFIIFSCFFPNYRCLQIATLILRVDWHERCMVTVSKVCFFFLWMGGPDSYPSLSPLQRGGIPLSYHVSLVVVSMYVEYWHKYFAVSLNTTSMIVSLYVFQFDISFCISYKQTKFIHYNKHLLLWLQK